MNFVVGALLLARLPTQVTGGLLEASIYIYVSIKVPLDVYLLSYCNKDNDFVTNIWNNMQFNKT